MTKQLDEALRLMQEARALRLVAADRCAFHLEALLDLGGDFISAQHELYQARHFVAVWNEARAAEEAAGASLRELALTKMGGVQ
jgi:hypothetical protein